MKPLYLLLVFAAACSACATAPAPTPEAPEPVVTNIVYHDPYGMEVVRDALIDGDFAEAIIPAASQAGVEVVNVLRCNAVNAFYHPGLNQVFLCYELLMLPYWFGGGIDFVAPVAEFVTLHEVGHAMVRKLKMTVPVYEESLVDQFAAIWMAKSGKSKELVASVVWFKILIEAGFGEDSPDDVHLSPARRLQDTLCLAVAHDAGNIGPALDAGLSLDKAFSCMPSVLDELVDYWVAAGVKFP